MTTHNIRILFKSGKEIELKCEHFKTESNGKNELVSVSWENCTNLHKLYIRLDDISMIYEVD